jgi:hypothetical protein
MNQKAFLILFSLLFFSNAEASDYIDKGYYVIDLKNRIEWLKCTTGQQWSDKKEECVGEPVKLNQKDVKEANKLLKEQIKGDWRLPNRKELESLVCMSCEGAKIDKKLFPGTPAEPFWTSERNWWSPKFFWSVNFFTGHSYGRFVPEKELFVRFVKNR